MRKTVVLVLVAALLGLGAVVPAAGDSGAGELNASFHAGLSSGLTNPEGRLEPFGDDEEICDQLVVGTWVFWVDPDRAVLDAITNEFVLDGEPLDTVRTPNKRAARGPFKGQWWFAEGVPVLGTLDAGLHTIEWTFDLGGGPASDSTEVNVTGAC